MLRVLGRYARPYRRNIIALVVLMMLDLAVESLMPLSLRLLIDKAIGPRSVKMLVLILGVLATMGLLAAAAALTRDWLYARLGNNVIRDLRTALFAHLQRLSMGFYARSEAGDILSRFSSDVGAVEGAVTSAVPTSFRALVGLLISGALLFSIEWRLALVSVLGVILCFRGAKRLEPKATGEGIRMRETQGKVSALLQENIGAQTVVKGFCLQKQATAKFRDLLERLFSVTVRASFLGYLVERIPNVGVLLLSLVVIAAGSMMAFRGDLTVGELVAFQGLFVNAAAYVEGFTGAFPQLLSATTAIYRIEEILAEEPLVRDTPDAVELVPLRDGIEFRDVVFGYAQDRRNLDGVNLRIARGQRAVFVGSSGSGKSTVLSLVMRFYDPTGGSVFFDGTDLRQIRQDSLRSQLGVVFQESLLFNTSIRENIRVGCASAGDAEIEAAARMAGIHDLIVSMEAGYDTVVGERGGRLSGGQRQRVGIARAIVRNPSVLILDEATSALDSTTESAVNGTLAEVSKGKTVLAVTHRLSLATSADVIFVMDKGRVVEQGSHAELLARGGVYAGLWAKQNGVSLSSAGDYAEVSVEGLKAVPLFADLAPEMLQALSADFVTERFAADRRIVHEGDPGDRFYVMVRGKVEVTKRKEGGGESRLAVLSDGDYFGEMALLCDTPRLASVTTLTDCVVLVLGRQRFASLMRGAPNILAALMATYTQRNAAAGNGGKGEVTT